MRTRLLSPPTQPPTNLPEPAMIASARWQPWRWGRRDAYLNTTRGFPDSGGRLCFPFPRFSPSHLYASSSPRVWHRSLPAGRRITPPRQPACIVGCTDLCCTAASRFGLPPRLPACFLPSLAWLPFTCCLTPSPHWWSRAVIAFACFVVAKSGGNSVMSTTAVRGEHWSDRC